MIIAIDFDGTIVHDMFPYIGPLKPNAKEVINKLFADGHEIIIWTCRGLNPVSPYGKFPETTACEVATFLRENYINYNLINQPSMNNGFPPSTKVYADIYIDDKQLGGIPDDWDDIYKILKEKHKL